jgi:hypothetical protein
MELVIADADGLGLDATVEVEQGVIVLHSRGGAVGSPNVRNRDYSTGLRLILRRLLENHFEITGAWVDSSRVQILPLEERKILTRADFPATSDALFTVISRRMQAVGRSPNAGPGRGNSNKRIRFSIEGRTLAEIIRAIGAIPKADLSGINSRLAAEELRKITPEHIWQAILEISEIGSGHEFGPSTGYDLLTDSGVRLPPKAVFGRAASFALSVRIGPESFSAGIGTPCFDILQKAGYRIVSKEGTVEHLETLSADEKVWAEGNPRLVSHLRRERGRGLSTAKKFEFVRKHGRLFCEKCKMVPVQVFGDQDGEACIEVHHHSTAVSEMDEGHETRLGDLQCLCANCHRYTHRVMKRNRLGI